MFFDNDNLSVFLVHFPCLTSKTEHTSVPLIIISIDKALKIQLETFETTRISIEYMPLVVLTLKLLSV
jgi:hypothetical protein